MRLQNQPKSIEVSQVFDPRKVVPQSIKNAGPLGWAIDFLRKQTGQGRHSSEFDRQQAIKELERSVAPGVFEARRVTKMSDARNAAAEMATSLTGNTNPFDPYLPDEFYGVNPYAPGVAGSAKGVFGNQVPRPIKPGEIPFK